VLVIQTAHLGDVVLTTPLLARLAEQHGPVDVVTTPAAAPLLNTHPAVARVIPYDKAGRDRGLGGFFKLVGILRRGRYDQALLPHESVRTGLMAWLARVPRRTGFTGAPGRLWYTERVSTPDGTHASRRMAMLAGVGQTPRPTLGLTEDDLRKAGIWLEEEKVPAGFIALAPGARWATKRWPHFAALAARLRDPLVVVGGPEDRALGEAIREAAPGRVWNSAGRFTLRESAALLRHARGLVCNDSLPLHLGAVAGCPTIAIFGPTSPKFGFGPTGPEDRVMEHPSLPCRPCSRHGPMTCPLKHHLCMRDVGVEAVARAVEGWKP
jgi:heptosyltransferase-2